MFKGFLHFIPVNKLEKTFYNHKNSIYLPFLPVIKIFKEKKNE